MKTKGFDFFILSTLSLSDLAIAAFAFVDDTEIVHSAPDPYCDSTDNLKEAQESLTSWEGILCTTGGAIGADNSDKAF